MLSYSKFQAEGLSHVYRFLIAFSIAMICLPASAVILLNFDTDTDSRFTYQSGNMTNIVITSAFPTASSSPALTRSLQRAHAWSHLGSPTLVYVTSPSRQSTLQSNMARANAFRQD